MGEKILVVDDALFMRKTIRRILLESGYRDVWEAKDGEEALTLFRERKPDLVILDITMPGKSGIDVLEEILAQDPKAQVVMCSAVGQEMMIQKALMMGAKDFIVKPFKTGEFQKVIKYRIENQTM